MLDEVKKQRIVGLIESSAILNTQEKADWLALLDLMNDKQIQELEEILLPKKPEANPVEQASKPISAPVAAKPMQPQAPQHEQPSLKHISNLPSQISTQRMSQPVKLKPMSAPAASTPVAGISMANKPAAKPQPVKQPAYQAPIRPRAESSPLVINSLEDIAGITSGALHQSNRKNFQDLILGIAQQHGYFQVVSFLEKSPLYKDYIAFGRIKLSNDSSQQLPLTQEEFEFVTDLLAALRVNRV